MDSIYKIRNKRTNLFLSKNQKWSEESQKYEDICLDSKKGFSAKQIANIKRFSKYVLKNTDLRENEIEIVKFSLIEVGIVN